MQLAPTRLYYASGSRGTQAGLELGSRLFSPPYRLFGIAVSGGEEEKRVRAARIANEAASLLGADVAIVPEELVTNQAHIGEGYGIPTPGCLEAIRLLAERDGVLLDPTYTAKAMAGLIADVRSGVITPDETIVFLHTGGVPALFAHADLFRQQPRLTLHGDAKSRRVSRSQLQSFRRGLSFIGRVSPLRRSAPRARRASSARRSGPDESPCRYRSRTRQSADATGDPSRRRSGRRARSRAG